MHIKFKKQLLLQSADHGLRTAAGFTLIEIIVVVGIVVLLLAVSVVLGVDTLQSYSRRGERDTLVAVLGKARSRAVNNMWQSPHGVCLRSDGYVLFRGVQYVAGDTANETVPLGSGVLIAGFPSCMSGGGIVFSQLAGTTTAITISLTQDGKVSTIDINEAGRID